MATIQDVMNTHAAAMFAKDLYGCTSEWWETFLDRCQETGEAIAADAGVTKEEAADLPPETTLGPKAEAAYARFREFVMPPKK